MYCAIFTKVLINKYIYIKYVCIHNYNKYTYSAGMKERCRDGCRTSLLIAGVVLVPAIFHTLLPPCHPYITIHFMEMIFSTCIIGNRIQVQTLFGCEVYMRLEKLMHDYL